MDAEIEKKIHRSGRPLCTILLISNKELNDIIKIVEALEDYNILLEGVTKTIKNEAKEKKRRIRRMLLGTLGASLLENIFAGKGIVRAGSGRRSLNSSTLYGIKK